MIRSLRDSKAHLSELVERASQGEDVLITVRGKVRARLTQAGVSVPAADVVAWRKELTRLSRKYRTGSKSTPSEKLLEDLREDRF
jgi:prevent-host-death family protein